MGNAKLHSLAIPSANEGKEAATYNIEQEMQVCFFMVSSFRGIRSSSISLVDEGEHRREGEVEL